MYVVCKFDYCKGHTYVCKVEDVNRGIEIANELVTSRFDGYAVYTEEDVEKLKKAEDFIQACQILSEYITGQDGFERNC